MNLLVGLSVGLAAAFAAQSMYAQSLPEFDETDFQIVSMQGDGNAVLRSDGRDFYCGVTPVSSFGYVLVSYCLPFVGHAEAREQDQYIFDLAAEQAKIDLEKAKVAEAEAKANADKVAAEAKANADKVAAEAKVNAAKIVAEAEAAAAEQKKLNANLKASREVVAKVSDTEIRVAIKSMLSASSNCTVDIGDRLIKSKVAAEAIWHSLGFTTTLDEPILDVLRPRIVKALHQLYHKGEIVYLDSASKIKLKDCN